VDRSDRFSMGLRKLWELVGHATIADGSRSRDALARHGIRVVHAEVESIDVDACTATVDGEALRADYLVFALGAVPRPDLVPGLAEHGHDVWSTSGIPGATHALSDLDGGRVLVLIAGSPYPCPPAPYECAMHVDQSLRSRGLRESTELSVATVQPMLMPNAGVEGSAWMAERLTERDISFRTGAKIERVDARKVVLEDGELPFDLLLTVPPHRAPGVVLEAGLTGESGWIPVDRSTLGTSHDNVYAVGDVTGITLSTGLPLPKAGVIAELEGTRVAGAIAAELRGEPEPEPFAGAASCYVELGTEVAARMDVKFFAEPTPEIAFVEPSAERAAEKRRFESDRLTRWFGA
jgi:sulfide:quinone oxidoreductase